MEITRRQFVKITALTTSGIVIGTPKTLLSSWNQEEKSVKNEDPKIRVVGIGGAGCCAVKHMIRTGLKQAEFIVADTDPGDLEFNSCRLKILIDVNPFKRGVCKGDPETVYLATLNSKEAIRRYLRGSDLVLIVAGLGGHTGTIGAPVVAQISKALGAWTVAVVTLRAKVAFYCGGKGSSSTRPSGRCHGPDSRRKYCRRAFALIHP